MHRFLILALGIMGAVNALPGEAAVFDLRDAVGCRLERPLCVARAGESNSASNQSTERTEPLEAGRGRWTFDWLRGPDPERFPHSSPPGRSGSANGAPATVLALPLPGGGLLMLTALGAVMAIRRRRFSLD